MDEGQPIDTAEKNLIEGFLQEIVNYRKLLKLALKEILGTKKSQDALDHLEDLEEKGCYISDPEIARKMGSFFVGREEDLGFYVFSYHDPNIKIEVKDNGVMSHLIGTISSRPVFLYWPKAITNKSLERKGQSLPPYFTPWIHEFGHFLCYWLQDYPIMIAMNILVGSLSQNGHPIRKSEDLLHLTPENVSRHVWELVRLLVQWSSLNEAMAMWWEDHLLRLMGFNVEAYMAPKKEDNPFVVQLETCNREKAIDYIQNWHKPQYYLESFTKAFLNSFSKVIIDKWSFFKE